MAIRTPNPTWEQPNSSDKFGNAFRTRNIDFSEPAYAKLSPRMVKIADDSISNFALTLAIGKQARGNFQVTTDDANFGVTIDTEAIDVDEDTGTNNPVPSFEGDGLWFQGLWHVADDDRVRTRPATGGASQAWTTVITSLTTTVRHVMEVFQSRVSLCVANGNVVKQYNSAYSNTIDLTIPSDFEISGMAYNNGRIGIITRLSNDGTKGQDQNTKFFIWRGATTGDNGSWDVGSDACVAIVPYKSSFAIQTRTGEWLYFNGGGFERLGAFAHFYLNEIYGDEQDNNALGQVHSIVDNDEILISTGNELTLFGIKEEQYLRNFPAGVSAYNPNVGLYHKYSLSNSQAYIYEVTNSNVNISTDVMTISSGTVPATGNIVRMTNGGVGGLVENKNYYIIKLTATTFKVATSFVNANSDTAIDLTTVGNAVNYFLFVDRIDYGTTLYDVAGAVALHNDKTSVYTDILAGGRIQDTDLSNLDCLCTAIPYMPNKGIIESPKFFSSEKEDVPKDVTVRFKPLNDESSIVIYARTKDTHGLPVSTPSKGATFTGKNDLYTSQDLSEAESYLSIDGSELFMEIIAGVGAGEIIKVVSITGGGGNYAICLDEEVFGVTAGDKCEFQLLDYQIIRTITSDDNDAGEVTTGVELPTSKFAQYMTELRGYDVTIEDILYNNSKDSNID